jgi:serine/threonine protein kinase/Tol biopolymer transport system component
MMERDRWEQIERLYNTALEREPDERAAYLDEACAGNDDLRREVAELLDADDPNDSFIQAPAIEIAARALAAKPLSEVQPGAQTAPPPRSLGTYQLLELLGRGGMGEVYLALDSRLGRKVAIKLLPAKFTADSSRVRRFAQEARAASALNHPNIITIYEIGETDATHYIVTEYVEGETLRQRMTAAPEQRIKLSEAIDVAAQIATALTAAHGAGIAHRDIKPENVMVRRDGIVKVLDFGLAKLIEARIEDRGSRIVEPQLIARPTRFDPRSSILDPQSTAPGLVMGTPRYMSPEQARGEKVDAKTDIFSLGVTLYEMITGRTPFVGSTSGEMIAALLRDEPPPLSRYAPETPPELQRLVGKALCKDREERYQGINDLLLDLKKLKQDLEFEAREVTARTGQTGTARATSVAEYLVSGVTRYKRGTLLALAVVAVIAFGLYRLIGVKQFSLGKPAPPLPAMKFDRLTNNGKAGTAAISPDGKYVAYTEREEGKQSLWIRQTTSASAVQIVPPAAIWYYWLSFSRDGDVIYYLADDAADGNSVRKTLYQIPVSRNATPRKLLANIWSSVALSPDGKRLAFVRWQFNQSERTLMLANVDGNGEQKLATSNSPSVFLRDLAWSPDGKIIACGVATPDDRATVIAVNVADGTQRPITSRRLADVRNMAWMADGSGLLLQASDPAEGTQPQLWRLSYPDGEARKLTNDLNNYQGISLAANLNLLVTVKVDYTSNIWIAPYGKASRAIQVTSGINIEEGGLGLVWTPDGKIVYASTESGNWDIWIVAADGSHKQQLTANAGRNFCPAVSPDGRYVVFGSDRTGVEDIWRMDLNGANLKQLTSGHIASRPYCSPDGRWVVYRKGSSGTATVWKVSIDGGVPAQVTGNDKPAAIPVISPNGKLLSYLVLNEQNKPTLNIIPFAGPFAGGEIIKTIDLPADVKMSGNYVWTADGRGVICKRTTGDGSNLWQQSLDGSSPTPLTDFKSGGIPWFDLSRDGKQLALSRSVLSGEVVLISNFR